MAFIALGAIAGALLSSQSESEKQTPIQQGRLAQATGQQYQPTTATQQQQPDSRLQDVLAASQGSASTSGPEAPKAPKVEAKPKVEATDTAGASNTLDNVAAAAELGGQVGGMLFQQPNLSLQGQLAQPSNYQYQPTVDPRRRIGSYY